MMRIWPGRSTQQTTEGIFLNNNNKKTKRHKMVRYYYSSTRREEWIKIQKKRKKERKTDADDRGSNEAYRRFRSMPTARLFHRRLIIHQKSSLGHGFFCCFSLLARAVRAHNGFSTELEHFFSGILMMNIFFILLAKWGSRPLIAAYIFTQR